ncbi:MAG: TadE/TadG family type IV pilus assembly protein [Alphaproteobacteria bacterium]|jgi:Flp pilus assembly protein TadG|nr:pilus assembly protein [Alphaproteobacteria bacterium]
MGQQKNKRFFLSERGNVAIEFALIMPILVTLVMGIFELNNYILAHNRLSRTASELANLICRQQTNAATITGYLKTPQVTLSQYNFAGYGTAIATHIYNRGQTTQAANMLIGWQLSVGSSRSKIGTAQGAPSNIPGSLVVTGPQEIVVVELYLTYKPVLSVPFLSLNTSLYKTAVFTSRVTTLYPLLT